MHLKQLMNCSKFDLITCFLEAKLKRPCLQRSMTICLWGANYSVFRTKTTPLDSPQLFKIAMSAVFPVSWQLWWSDSHCRMGRMPPMGDQTKHSVCTRDPSSWSTFLKIISFLSFVWKRQHRSCSTEFIFPLKLMKFYQPEVSEGKVILWKE